MSVTQFKDVPEGPTTLRHFVNSIITNDDPTTKLGQINKISQFNDKKLSIIIWNTLNNIFQHFLPPSAPMSEGQLLENIFVIKT